MRPLILDLFCGAGGAAMGLYRAGFDVVGVDIKFQKNFPSFHSAAYAKHFNFIQGDALKPPVDLTSFDAIWASPPCQGYSRASSCRPGLADTYDRLIPALRTFLQSTHLPYVIENVQGAPLLSPITLCGSMFRKLTYRHRLFESSLPLWQFLPDHPKHNVPAERAGYYDPNKFISVAGHCSNMEAVKTAMEIDWMTRDELVESIPPYMSRFIGQRLIKLGVGK